MVGLIFHSSIDGFLKEKEWQERKGVNDLSENIFTINNTQQRAEFLSGYCKLKIKQH